ncbi:putative dipeptidyl-aminopeptidase B [Acrodontium crateriforme]|uniref:dipeptidyl-peptidase IV n=1 Tax=Acrodontium crateriforme TaxID=150365 RepID=A0AAQ3R8Z5_9PEZI|nr:putative dipeptidyl-aminopeptidase B [Acrodontium crateriforme]
MAKDYGNHGGEESQPLTQSPDDCRRKEARNSFSSVSTTSLVLEHASGKVPYHKEDAFYGKAQQEEMDMEDQPAWQRQSKSSDRRARRIIHISLALGIIGWVAALFLFISQNKHVVHSARPHDPHATSTHGNGKKVTLEQVLTGQWYAKHHAIQWIPGPNGEDGLLLERDGPGGRDFLVVEDVRYRGESFDIQKQHSTTLMKSGQFQVDGQVIRGTTTFPNHNHTKVLVCSDYASQFRHSGTGRYWIFDVASQTAEALDPENINARVQIASWSPDGRYIVFTRGNNMFMRQLDSRTVTKITTDGGTDVFYGVPDWVYEEEVFASDSATWWSGDSKYIAFLRTDESAVPSFPVDYFFSHPSGKRPKAGEENYPETKWIKYPKAGAPMSVVKLRLYDVEKSEIFDVPIKDDFPDDDRLITEVLWAGETGRLIVRSTNRESDILKTILIDANMRKGRTVRERDVLSLDGGWFEISETTTFVPHDVTKGREHDGYVDTVIHNGFDHLAYFAPLDNPEPRMLTEGDWEVVSAPSSIDLRNNLVYFTATKDGSTQRHIYTVDLNVGPSSIKAITDTSEIGYYEASFSAASSFMLLSYQGPHIPWQKVQSTPSNRNEKLSITLEENKALNDLAKRTELPIEKYQTINVDGYELNVVERLPPHFDKRKKYPVLFFLYNGPGFQLVDRKFHVDFQSYVASSLGYIVVTVDGRGTGFLGRKHRCIVRGNLGYWEAYDQIAAAKMWAAKSYVDEERMAIWGWSYGGFMALKTLEQDAGQTFHYGMAVAPVTDWRYYDSIYTERYMHTPQHNLEGYNNATVSNMTALSQNVRFLVMHGASDDNVHLQNTLSLLDKLDEANVKNYDMHLFPDSDHSIFFHNGNRMVYNRLSDWLVNAFNGEWLRTEDPRPMGQFDGLS